MVCALGGLAVLNGGCRGGGTNESDLGALDDEQAPKVTFEAGTELEVTADELNLLTDPAAGSEVRGVLTLGTVVIVFETSGQQGFVHVMAPDIGAEGEPSTGFVSTKYVKPASTGNGVAGAAPRQPGGDGSSCDQAKARGAVGEFQKALHDTIAYAEGTRDYSHDGYDVMYSYKIATSCTNHPNQCLRFGRTCSTAAGRYQYLKGTWDRVKAARGLSSFEPQNQEQGAEWLVSTARKVTIAQERAMTPSEFNNMLSKLSYEWASFPPGRYGQPTHDAAVLRVDYCRRAGCDGTARETSSSSSGSSGASSSSGSSGSSGTSEESCAGRTDGYYCSTIDARSAYECRGGARAGTTQCADASKRCKPGTGGTASLSQAQLVCQ